MNRLTKAQARRIAVRAQLLDARRPTELLTVVHQLTLLQIDPTAACSRACWRWQDRTLFEHNALVRPMSDLGLHLAASRTSRSHERTHAWIRDWVTLRLLVQPVEAHGCRAARPATRWPVALTSATRLTVRRGAAATARAER